MGRFDKYKIDLKGLKVNSMELDFELDNRFFADIDGQEFQRGNVKAKVTLKRNYDVYEFLIATQGVVTVSCDRCLDDMEIEVLTQDSIRVKLGESYADEGNIVVIPESEGDINLAWYLYEFIALAIPLKHIHGPGKCNKEMTGKLKKHLCAAGDDVEQDDNFSSINDAVDMEKSTDPRWDELKNIQIEEDF